MDNKGLITISYGERSRVNRLTAGVAFEQMRDFKLGVKFIHSLRRNPMLKNKFVSARF